MKKIIAFWPSLVMAFLGVPILAQCAALTGGVVIAIVVLIADLLKMGGPLEDHSLAALIVLTCLMMVAGGRVWSRENSPESHAEWRHGLLLLPAIVVLISWMLAMQRADLDFLHLNSNGLIAVLIPWFGIDIVMLLEQNYWGLVLFPVCSQVSFALGYGGKQWLSCRAKPRSISLAILVLCALVALFQAWQHAQKFLPTLYEDDLSSRQFEPGKWGNKLTPIQGSPALQITQNWPRMDGATAALPLYASAFYGLIALRGEPSAERYLVNSGTPQAYKNIINNQADIIFVAQPSLAQKQRAEIAGVSLVYTPFAREAFVFIVNKDNPVQTLSDAQVRAIYSGAVTQWCDVGGDASTIQAWQRPKDSGSQTVMLAKVMRETPMSPAPETRIAAAMGGIIDVVAEYQNTQGAIGYTFRYYATQMKANNGIKLLEINGIAPTVENIHNGTYPYTVDVYMVTREHPSAETQKVMDWFLSPQGQRLVQDVGYVPLYPTIQ